MKRQSDKMKERLVEYHSQIEKDDWLQSCKLCGLRTSKNVLQRHHPKRRLNGNLLNYIYVCYICHDEIEKGQHPEYLPRDNDHEKKFHGLGPEDNMLKNK